jgi:hypothetical protein
MAQRRMNRATLDKTRLIDLALERVDLPIGLISNLEYQPDVDLLSIHFRQPIDEELLRPDDEEGIVGIYDGEKLVGVEILDITGNLDAVNPR